MKEEQFLQDLKQHTRNKLHQSFYNALRAKVREMITNNPDLKNLYSSEHIERYKANKAQVTKQD